MENKNFVCPYCGSENIERIGDAFEEDNKTPYHCHECNSLFGEEDITRENIRHKLSAILMDTNENSQMKCEIVIEPEDSCGLSTLQMPIIDSCFQEPCEGTIWFHFKGHYANLDTLEKEYANFDDIETKALKVILGKLCHMTR